MKFFLSVVVLACLCFAPSVRSFCNFTAPLDSAWIADAFSRCGQIAECDRSFGVSRGLTVASFEQFVAQAGLVNTTGALDAFVCSKTPRDAAIETFLLQMIIRPPIDTCPPQQEYRPATRTCGFALDVVPTEVQLTAIVEPILLGLIVLLLSAVILIQIFTLARRLPNK